MAAQARGKSAKSRLNTERLWTHLSLALFTIVGCQFAVIFAPSAILAEPLTLGLGYVSLFYIALSLLIGPLYLVHRRRNPVNIYLRRDIGIWAGLTALLHVLLSFQIFEQGQILLYFFSRVRDQYIPLGNLFGLSNYIGLLAAVLALILLVFSNDVSLRWLKGKHWKLLQRLTYPLMVLAILHTLGFQLDNGRSGVYVLALVVFTLIVALVQGTGVLVYLQRRQAQPQAAWQPAPAPGGLPAGPRPAHDRTTLAPLPPFEPDALDRRRFLLLSGATLLAGFAGLVSFRVSQEVFSHLGRARTAIETNPVGPTSAAGNGSTPPTAPPTAQSAAQGAPEATAPPAAQATVPPPAQATVPPAAQPTATNPAAATPATPDTGTSGGVVLATVTSCPVNTALHFTAPDTGESCILVHEADGSVKAFSDVCPHRPYPVEYDPSSQILVCPLHRALFDAQTGEVTQGPAQSGLPIISIHIDGQGNIVYG